MAASNAGVMTNTVSPVLRLAVFDPSPREGATHAASGLTAASSAGVMTNTVSHLRLMI